MRNLEQFNLLPPSVQLLYVWENCYYLAERVDEESVLVKMYQVETFFVEIRFRSPSQFELLRAFRNPLHLQPYLDQIDIKSLLK